MLAAKLGRAGYDPDRLEDLEIAKLLEALAETMLAEHSAETETDLFGRHEKLHRFFSPPEIQAVPLRRAGAQQSVSGSWSSKRNGGARRTKSCS